MDWKRNSNRTRVFFFFLFFFGLTTTNSVMTAKQITEEFHNVKFLFPNLNLVNTS